MYPYRPRRGGRRNEDLSMGDPSYKRHGGRKSAKRLAWLPSVWNGIATQKSGARYAMRKDGWRRLADAGRKE